MPVLADWSSKFFHRTELIEGACNKRFSFEPQSGDSILVVLLSPFQGFAVS